jgi:hypothetical protein
MVRKYSKISELKSTTLPLNSPEIVCYQSILMTLLSLMRKLRVRFTRSSIFYLKMSIFHLEIKNLLKSNLWISLRVGKSLCILLIFNLFV